MTTTVPYEVNCSYFRKNVNGSAFLFKGVKVHGKFSTGTNTKVPWPAWDGKVGLYHATKSSDGFVEFRFSELKKKSAKATDPISSPSSSLPPPPRPTQPPQLPSPSPL